MQPNQLKILHPVEDFGRPAKLKHGGLDIPQDRINVYRLAEVFADIFAKPLHAPNVPQVCANAKWAKSIGWQLAFWSSTQHNIQMSSREMVIELVGKLPEDMPLAEIAREIELLAGIQTAREQARRKEGTSPEDVRKLVDSWTSK